MQRILLALVIAFTQLALPAHGAQLNLHGRSIHYSVRGNGPTVILVHGWTCDESAWAFQVPVLARQYRVVTLDLPGHGRSEAPPDGTFTMDLFADAVEAVRSATGANRVVLVGHSMGAPVIRQYALSHPEHVAGLVAADGPLDIRLLTAKPISFPPMTLALRREMVEKMFVPGTPEAVRERVRKMMLGTSETTAQGASGLMFDPKYRSETIINAPALTIYAGKPQFPIDPSTREMLPNWSYTQISGTGHFLMMDNPKAFDRLLLTFLSRRARF